MISRRQFGAGCLAALAPSGFARQNPPKLLVLVLVEGFCWDSLPLSSPSLSPGGFRKLMDRAAWFPDCQHLASTFPATTLSTIATGAWPAQHGIVADVWYDRESKT